MDFIIDEGSQPVTQERQIVPAGVREMVIKHAEEGPNEYKVCDINPDGMCLKLRLSTVSGDYKFVFHDIPRHLSWMAKQLAEAVGIQADGGKLSLDPDTLVGLPVTVEISHYTSKAGNVSAVVKRYVAAEPAKKQAAPRKHMAAAMKRTIETDDIPF